MKDLNIAVLGAGNMGTSIVTGLLSSGYSPAQIIVSDQDKEKFNKLQSHNVQTTFNNKEAVNGAQIIILAVKPHHIKTLLDEISGSVNPEKQILISIAAGINTEDISSVIGEEIPVFLAMPNTSISIRESFTCIATQNGTSEQTNTVKGIFDQLGTTIVVDEHQMSGATVLAACGTAFALRFIRAAALGGIEMGFKPETATAIAAQIAKGASQMLLENAQHPEQELDKVVTPKGITIKGINEMEHQGFSSALIQGLVSSYSKVDDMFNKKIT
jgi:pyrroline-5-carboxylate reductase